MARRADLPLRAVISEINSRSNDNSGAQFHLVRRAKLPTSEMQPGTLAGPKVFPAFFESPEGLQQAVGLGREAER